MPNSFFSFKQFTIHQDRCAMKVGTDGILLGAWAPVEQATRILDIGTGTGLLALMAAQRNPNAQIDAVEIDPKAAAQATENFAQSPWRDRLHVFQADINDFEPGYGYDCIICNPPFFQTGVQPSDPSRRKARHTVMLSPQKLLTSVQKHLSEEGLFHVILPIEEGNHFMEIAQHVALFPANKASVRPTPLKPPHRILITLGRKEKLWTENNLSIYDESGLYSNPFKALTQIFYLNL